MQIVRRDLYEILGVSRDATVEQIRRAYRRKALEHHPDRGGDPERFREIEQAYRVLVSESRRSRYDETGDTQETKAERDIRQSVFDDLANRVASGDLNPHKSAASHLASERRRVEGEKRGAQKRLDDLTDRLARFRKANAQSSNREAVEAVELRLSTAIRSCQQDIAMCDNHLVQMTSAMSLLDDLHEMERPVHQDLRTGMVSGSYFRTTTWG